MRSDLGVQPRRCAENVPILVSHLHGQETCETSSLLSTLLFAKQNALRAQQTSRCLCSRRPALDLGEVETRSPPSPASMAITDPEGKQADRAARTPGRAKIHSASRLFSHGIAVIYPLIHPNNHRGRESPRNVCPSGVDARSGLDRDSNGIPTPD